MHFPFACTHWSFYLHCYVFTIVFIAEEIAKKQIQFPGLLGDLPSVVVAAEVVGEGLEEALDDDGVALAEEVGQRALVPDEHVGDEVRDDKLDLGEGRRGVHDGALEDEAAEADAGLGGVGGELGERVGGRDVEDELVLERGEHGDHEPGRAGEGEPVGPEAARLQLPRAGADVRGARAGGGPRPPRGRGEAAEEGAERGGGGGGGGGGRRGRARGKDGSLCVEEGGEGAGLKHHLGAKIFGTKLSASNHGAKLDAKIHGAELAAMSASTLSTWPRPRRQNL